MHVVVLLAFANAQGPAQIYPSQPPDAHHDSTVAVIPSFVQGTTAAQLGVTAAQLQQAARGRAAAEAMLEFRAGLAAEAPWAPAVSVCAGLSWIRPY